MRSLIVLFLLSGSKGLLAQKLPVSSATNRVAIIKKDTLYQFYAIAPIKKIKLQKDRFYYWYTQDTIVATQGAFSNRLLHGAFKQFYPNKNLCQQGNFRDGLKDGEWMTWYPAGQIKTIYNWSNGVLGGKFTEYDEEGHIIRQGTYKEGQLSGAVATRLPDGKISTIQYKRGVPILTESDKKNKPDSTNRALPKKQ